MAARQRQQWRQTELAWPVLLSEPFADTQQAYCVTWQLTGQPPGWRTRGAGGCPKSGGSKCNGTENTGLKMNVAEGWGMPGRKHKQHQFEGLQRERRDERDMEQKVRLQKKCSFSRCNIRTRWRFRRTAGLEQRVGQKQRRGDGRCTQGVMVCRAVEQREATLGARGSAPSRPVSTAAGPGPGSSRPSGQLRLQLRVHHGTQARQQGAEAGQEVGVSPALLMLLQARRHGAAAGAAALLRRAAATAS